MGIDNLKTLVHDEEEGEPQRTYGPWDISQLMEYFGVSSSEFWPFWDSLSHPEKQELVFTKFDITKKAA